MAAWARIPSVEAPRVPVTSSYHGLDVTEDYRWLEDASSPETVAWTQAQRELTRAYFESLPWRDGLRARVDELLRAERTSYGSLASAGGTYFALKEQTPRQRPFLVALTDLNHRSVVGRGQSRSRRRSRNTVSRQMPSSLAIRGRTARVR